VKRGQTHEEDGGIESKKKTYYVKKGSFPTGSIGRFEGKYKGGRELLL